eukprot:s5419_g9.t1
MDSDAKSQQSTASTAGASGMVINGVVFLKIKHCVACGRKNCDPNEITIDPSEKFTQWHRGSSTDPTSKYCRLCHLTHFHGGFAEQGSTVEDVAAQMRKDSQLNAEFLQARGEMKSLVNEGRIMRFRGATANNAKMKLQECRKRTVEEYKASEQELVSAYVAYDRSKFEQDFPGRIEQQNLKTTFKFIDGQRREIVLVRKRPDGEWELNIKERSGVVHTEQVDTSDLQISNQQHTRKYEGSRKRLFQTVEGKTNSAAAAEAVKPDDNRKDKPAASPIPEEEGSDSSDDGLARRSSLFEDPASPPKRKAGPGAGQAGAGGAARAAPGRVAANLGGQSSANAPGKNVKGGTAAEGTALARQRVSVSTTTPTTTATQKEQQQEKELQERGRPNKFKGKSTFEVLETHGLVEVKRLQGETKLGKFVTSHEPLSIVHSP